MDDSNRLFTWVAVRSIGEAVTRTANDVKEIKNYLTSKSFGIGAYKGVKFHIENGIDN